MKYYYVSYIYSTSGRGHGYGGSPVSTDGPMFNMHLFIEEIKANLAKKLNVEENFIEVVILDWKELTEKEERAFTAHRSRPEFDSKKVAELFFEEAMKLESPGNAKEGLVEFIVSFDRLAAALSAGEAQAVKVAAGDSFVELALLASAVGTERDRWTDPAESEEKDFATIIGEIARAVVKGDHDAFASAGAFALLKMWLAAESFGMDPASCFEAAIERREKKKEAGT